MRVWLNGTRISTPRIFPKKLKRCPNSSEANWKQRCEFSLDHSVRLWEKQDHLFIYSLVCWRFEKLCSVYFPTKISANVLHMVNCACIVYLCFCTQYFSTSTLSTLFPGQHLREKLESRLPLAADRLIILNLQTGDADQSFNWATLTEDFSFFFFTRLLQLRRKLPSPIVRAYHLRLS